MTQTHALRITYQSPPGMSRALASALVEEEGVTVSGLVVDGTTRAINAAVNSSGDGGRYG